ADVERTDGGRANAAVAICHGDVTRTDRRIARDADVRGQMRAVDERRRVDRDAGAEVGGEASSGYEVAAIDRDVLVGGALPAAVRARRREDWCVTDRGLAAAAGEIDPDRDDLVDVNNAVLVADSR